MSEKQKTDWNNLVPRHEIEWENGSDGMAVLLVPRFRKGILAKWVQPKLKKPHIRVKLDDVGSFVWLAIDGKTTFENITTKMKTHFGDKAEPAAERLQKFLLILHKNKFVQLLAPATT